MIKHKYEVTYNETDEEGETTVSETFDNKEDAENRVKDLMEQQVDGENINCIEMHKVFQPTLPY